MLGEMQMVVVYFKVLSWYKPEENQDILRTAGVMPQ
jgi:hypothetical protein